MDEEYEILSHEEVERLKKEAEKYKKNPLMKEGEDKLYIAIIDLIKELRNISSIFDDVKKQIIKEYQKGEGPDAKLDRLLDQNENIAKALVSFGEKMESNSSEEDYSYENKKEPPEEIEEPSFDFDYPTSSEAPMEQPAKTAKSEDLDYQAWNYNKPNKPGVSRSNFEQSNEEFKQNTTQQPFQSNSPPPQNFQDQELGEIPSPFEDKNQEQEMQIPKNEQEFSHFGKDNFQSNSSNQEVPGLKPINKEGVQRRKKRSFGLF